jgi:hypothetical protein
VGFDPIVSKAGIQQSDGMVAILSSWSPERGANRFDVFYSAAPTVAAWAS